MNTVDSHPQFPFAGPLASALGLRVPRGPVNWSALGAALAAALLLGVFAQIVLTHVRESELRKRAGAAYLERLWRCNLLQSVAQRGSCRANLNTKGLAAVATSL